jgi:hypothetical protein
LQGSSAVCVGHHHDLCSAVVEICRRHDESTVEIFLPDRGTPVLIALGVQMLLKVCWVCVRHLQLSIAMKPNQTNPKATCTHMAEGSRFAPMGMGAPNPGTHAMPMQMQVQMTMQMPVPMAMPMPVPMASSALSPIKCVWPIPRPFPTLSSLFENR